MTTPDFIIALFYAVDQEMLAAGGFEGDSAKHLIEIGGTQRLQDVPQTVIIE
jgi:hypothetical protein